jgi:hypothetical protein
MFIPTELDDMQQAADHYQVHKLRNVVLTECNYDYDLAGQVSRYSQQTSKIQEDTAPGT